MAKTKQIDTRLADVPVIGLTEAINAEYQRKSLQLIRATTMLRMVAQMIESGDVDRLTAVVGQINEAASLQ